MWWQDAITVAVICLIMVSLVTVLMSAVLVMEPAMAAHCDECGRAMFDSHLDGTPVCLHCRFDHHLPAGTGTTIESITSSQRHLEVCDAQRPQSPH